MLYVSSGLRDDLVALLRHSPRDDYADTLVTVADRMAAHGAVLPPSGDSELSAREQGVLRYLQTRLSTREIAGELFISMNTLKSHLKSVYRKLDASSRSDAVARARAGWSPLNRPERHVGGGNHPLSGDDPGGLELHTHHRSHSRRQGRIGGISSGAG